MIFEKKKRMRRVRFLVVGILSTVLLCGVVLYGSYILRAWSPSLFSLPGALFQTGDDTWVRVTRIVDGDTFEIEGGKKVRYIGINAPESVHPRRSAQCFGTEASHFNQGLIEGKRVRMQKDISEMDRYGRLLRFVYLEDGTFVNEQLVREGYAFASAYPPDTAQSEFFTQAETSARMEQRGLWSPEACER